MSNKYLVRSHFVWVKAALVAPTLKILNNGDDFVFIKLDQQDTRQYALSDKFTLWKRENELYKVLSILKKLGQLISQ